jgi:hypothetical protein
MVKLKTIRILEKRAKGKEKEIKSKRTELKNIIYTN